VLHRGSGIFWNILPLDGKIQYALQTLELTIDGCSFYGAVCVGLCWLCPPLTSVFLDLREMREEKKLSQGDIEKRTGLLRCYISRVENAHTVPAIETLEKMARALECPLYQLFYEGEEPPKLPNLLKRKSSDEIAWGSTGKEARYLNKLRHLLGKTEESDRQLLLYMAQKMANR